MKILLIASPFCVLNENTYKSYTGMELLTYDLARELSLIGEDVTVACPKGSKIEDCSIIETQEANKELKENEDFVKYKHHLINFDIIHDMTHAKFVYLAKRKNKELKVISTIHDWFPFKTTPCLYPNFVCVSHAHSLFLSPILGVPIRTVYNGIKVNRYEYCEEKEDYFLDLGRIAQEKGVVNAIDCVKRARKELIIAGEDVFVPSLDYVYNVMERCDGTIIKYIGSVEHKKKVELLKKAKAILLLSTTDPFNLVAVEALACGTPIITLENSGGIKEIVEHGKSGFIAKNYDEVVDYIKQIDDINPISCRKRAQDFTTEKMANKYIELYKEILRGEEW